MVAMIARTVRHECAVQRFGAELSAAAQFCSTNARHSNCFRRTSFGALCRETRDNDSSSCAASAAPSAAIIEIIRS